MTIEVLFTKKVVNPVNGKVFSFIQTGQPFREEEGEEKSFGELFVHVLSTRIQAQQKIQAAKLAVKATKKTKQKISESDRELLWNLCRERLDPFPLLAVMEFLGIEDDNETG